MESLIKEEVIRLHAAAHQLDNEYETTRQKYFRGRETEVELGFSFVTRREAICRLHERYLDMKADEQNKRVAKDQVKDNYIDELLKRALAENKDDGEC